MSSVGEKRNEPDMSAPMPEVTVDRVVVDREYIQQLRQDFERLERDNNRLQESHEHSERENKRLKESHQQHEANVRNIDRFLTKQSIKMNKHCIALQGRSHLLPQK